MPSSAATCEPRKMLPPPTTIANSAPASTASATLLAVQSRLAGSIPYPFSPARLSPESLRTMRFTGPSSESPVPSDAPILAESSIVFLELVPDEAPDNDVLADPLNRVLQEVADRLVRLLDVGLGQQGLLGLPLAHPALDYLGLDVLGLAHLGDLLVHD